MSTIPVAEVIAVDGLNYMPEPIKNSNNNESINTLPPRTNIFDNRSDDNNAKQYLNHHGWPTGMQNALLKSTAKVPLRFFIIDDSGSMITNDGHMLTGVGSKTKLVPCTRWKELTQAMKFHVGLAKAARAPSEFRLLNGAPPILVGGNNPQEEIGISTLNIAFDDAPRGGTPLCKHIVEVVNEILPIAGTLRQNSQRVVVVIATDGESSDGDITACLRPLERLPVYLVIRLCTDDPKIVDYWNTIDASLELDMDVLDDFASESEEIMSVNNWITYGEPLHRFREFGSHIKELDVLDEASLSIDQMMNTVSMILDTPINRLPHPSVDWNRFIEVVVSENNKLPKIWNPSKKSMTTWIDPKNLGKSYNNNSNCTIM
jgi:hypothetical protein